MMEIGSVTGTGCTAETDSGRAGMKQDNAAVIALSNGNPDMPARTHDVSGVISGYLAARDEGSPAAGSKFCRHLACGHDIAAGDGTADRRAGCIFVLKAGLCSASVFQMRVRKMLTGIG